MTKSTGLALLHCAPILGTITRRASDVRTLRSQERSQMPRKPNYEFERRERARLKAIKNAEKAQAKQEARERAKAEAAGTPAKTDPPEPA